MATKRPYAKSSPYWEARKQASLARVAPAAPTPQIAQVPFMEGEASFDGKTPFGAVAACGSVGGTSYQQGVAPSIVPLNSFPNITAGVVPITMVENNYAVNGAIALVYSAYFNFALLRNAISMLTDFSVSPIHVKTTNARVKTFIETWLEAIRVNDFQQQFYTEYYRSGNVWIYKFSGKISEDGLNMLKQAYSKETKTGKQAFAARQSKTVPIRYTILNPMQVFLQRGASYDYGYVRMLSTYEIERLKNPQTEEDKQIFQSFPKDIQRQIKQGGSWRYLFVPLDQNRLYYVFYRKMDYEPLAVPMAYPLLNDIEFKMNLRRIDMTLVNSMEQVFMLVTAGQPANQYNLAPSNRQLATLQNIFSNQSIGRVLVADYTTKAEWVLPDMKDLLGQGKYAQVDKDIREGLQFMFFGDEKFANASIKIKIFLESLKEGRRAFLENFLMPEVKKVCEQMNFRDVPTLEFEEIRLQDEALMNRLYVQMGQLGFLTPEEVNTAVLTGDLPTPEESLTHQEALKKAKDKGYYQMVAPPTPSGAGGGSNVGKGRPGGTGGTPATRQISTPIGQTKASVDEGDISRESPFHFGMVRIAENLVKMDKVRATVEATLMKTHKVEELNAAQQLVADQIAQSVVFNEPEKQWQKAAVAYVKKGPKDMPKDIAREINEIRAAYDAPETPVGLWLGGVLLKSKVDFVPDATNSVS
jgi:hypothetical protein